VKQKTSIISLMAATAAVLTIAVVLAGCGSTTPAEAPSTIYPESSPTSGPAALKAYLSDAKVVLADLSTTAAGVPDAVAGMSKKPDSTWSTAATNLQDISTQLGDEATALAALQPPEALQPVQDAVVTGIQAAQTATDKLAAALEKGENTAATKQAQIQSTVDSVTSQIQSMSDMLSSALGGL
jgi:chaperonin cofactor prefoldin